MAINNSRNMNAELEQGLRDGTYMHVNPDWSVNTPVPTERLSWPTFAQAERHQEGSVVVYAPLTPREPAPKGGMYTVSKGYSALDDD